MNKTANNVMSRRFVYACVQIPTRINKYIQFKDATNEVIFDYGVLAVHSVIQMFDRKVIVSSQ